MIKVDKTVLEFLKIKSVYIEENDSLFPCVPVEIAENFMRVIAFKYKALPNVTIKFLTSYNRFIELQAVIKATAAENQYAVFFSEKLPDEIKSKLMQIEDNKKFSDKRDGNRYVITEKNYSDLNLETNHVTVVICGVELSATLQDISIHGVRFTAELPSKIQDTFLEQMEHNINSLIGLKLLFIKPVKVIFLILLARHFTKKENKFSIGCAIKPPYNIEYTNRLIKFLTIQEENYVLEQRR